MAFLRMGKITAITGVPVPGQVSAVQGAMKGLWRQPHPTGRRTLPQRAVIHSRQGLLADKDSDMYEVRTATSADLGAVIALVARLQQEPAHQIGFHGETEDEIAEELSALTPDWAGGAVLAADRNGRVRGVLTVEVAGKRAYLYGPFVDVPANHPAAGHVWQATADAMLTHARGLPRLAGVRTLELFGHRDNRLLADFAARHGAPVRM